MANLHPKAPWGEITFAGVYWNCAPRLEKLLEHVRPWFKKIAVAVQESPDDTLKVAEQYADYVLKDKWHGRGDPSLTTLIRDIGNRKWAFVISDDEWPTEELLYSFQDLTEAMVKDHRRAAWFHFRSTIDGYEFTKEQDEHLRLFVPSAGWPSSPHSRPPIENGLRWRPNPESYIRHDRSLDEMMQDYVRRYDLTAKEPTWTQQQAHNVRMMQGACNAIAERKGWKYVSGFDWWPRVSAIGYDSVTPEGEPEGEPETLDAADAVWSTNVSANKRPRPAKK